MKDTLTRLQAMSIKEINTSRISEGIPDLSKLFNRCTKLQLLVIFVVTFYEYILCIPLVAVIFSRLIQRYLVSPLQIL